MPDANFETFRYYSQLPPHIETEDQLWAEDPWLIVNAGTHDEPLHIDWVEHMQQTRNYPKGVLPLIANPHAIAEGLRYIGDGSEGLDRQGEQLMAHFPGTMDSIYHEDKVAAGIMWFVNELESRDVPYLFADYHDCPEGYLEFEDRHYSVSDYTVPEAFAFANALGYKQGHMINGGLPHWEHNMRNHISAYIGIERPYVAPAQRPGYYRTLDRHLTSIAEGGPEELQDSYEDLTHGTGFFSPKNLT